MEESYLLDSIVLRDTLLLTFDDTGSAIPNPIYDKNTWEYKRAKESIRRYHLDYRLIVQERERIWKEVQKLIYQTENWLNAPIKSPIVNIDIENNMKKLRKMTRKEAVLSSTAIASIKSSSAKWARELASR